MSSCSSSGGDDSSSPPPTSASAPSSGSTSAGSGNAGVAAATAYLAPFLQKSTDIGVDVPLTGKPPTGKVIYDVNIQNPLAVEQTDGMKEAAKLLGWTVKSLLWTTNPADANRYILQAVQAKADFIRVNAVPDAIIKQGVAAAKAANIPIFLAGSTTVPAGKDNWTFANTNDAKRFDMAGRIGANYLVSKFGDSTPKILNVDISGSDVQAAQTNGFKDELAKNCPKCGYEHVGVTFGDLAVAGKSAGVAVAYLRVHPDIKQVIFGAGGLSIGFAAAAKQANLTGLTVTSINGLTTNLAAIDKGDELATVSEGLPYLGWLAADAMARYSLGMDGTPNWNAVIPELIQTKDNIAGPNDEFTGPTDYQKSFAKLWQVSQ